MSLPMLSYSPGWVGRSVASVCLFICTLIGKWLELSTPNLVHIYSIAVECIDPEVKGQGHTATKTVTVARLLVTSAAMAIASVDVHVV